MDREPDTTNTAIAAADNRGESEKGVKRERRPSPSDGSNEAKRKRETPTERSETIVLC